MEEIEISNLTASMYHTKDLVCINVGGHGGDTAFLTISETKELINFLTNLMP